MSEPTDEELDEWQENFDHFDSDGDGRIDFGEFGALLEALGGQLGGEELRIGFAEVDEDGDGSIDFEEFVDWWQDARG